MCAASRRRCSTSARSRRRCPRRFRRCIGRSPSRISTATSTNRPETRSPPSLRSFRTARCSCSTTGSTTAAIQPKGSRARSANSSRPPPSGARCNPSPTRPSAIRSPSSAVNAPQRAKSARRGPRMSPHVNVRHLIVGAGPTGLGAAWRLENRGIHDWLVLEAGDVAGGLAQSVVDEHGFTWDLGGHVQFSHYEMFDQLMDELLGVDGWLYHDRESWVWIRGRFAPYPFQLNLHRLPDADQAACLHGLMEAAAAASPSRPLPANFGEWIAQTFGAGIAELFMRPYNRKVWARDPELMDWRWIGDRVAVADVARGPENIRLHRDDVSWCPNNPFRFPPRGGTGALLKALAERLTQRESPGRPSRLMFGANVRHVDTTARRVALADGREFGYEQLISTMPLDRLIAISDVARDLRAAARHLEYSSTHVIG